jgi:pimeloyl-ACP methyl ester carboxylesterase
VSLVADRVPDKFRTLVYLDAFVPDEGMRLVDYLPAEMRDVVRAQAAENEGAIPPIPAAFFKVNEADAANVDRLCVNQPIATFEQPVHFDGGIKKLDGHKVYIWASEFEGTFGEFYAASRDDASWRTFAVACGHDVMLDEPDRLTEILEDVAD